MLPFVCMFASVGNPIYCSLLLLQFIEVTFHFMDFFFALFLFSVGPELIFMGIQRGMAMRIRGFMQSDIKSIEMR